MTTCENRIDYGLICAVYIWCCIIIVFSVQRNILLKKKVFNKKCYNYWTWTEMLLVYVMPVIVTQLPQKNITFFYYTIWAVKKNIYIFPQNNQLYWGICHSFPCFIIVDLYSVCSWVSLCCWVDNYSPVCSNKVPSLLYRWGEGLIEELNLVRFKSKTPV